MGQVHALITIFRTRPLDAERTSLPPEESPALVLIICTFITVDTYFSSLGILHGWGSHLAGEHFGMDAYS